MKQSIQEKTTNIAFDIWFDTCMENADKNDASNVHCYEFEERIYLVNTATNRNSNTTLDSYLKRVLSDEMQDN